MFLTKKHIPRRTFLRGAGITLGLPLLDSMVPAQTPLKDTAASPVRRFVGIWHPHGAAPGYWSPLQQGSDFELSFITKPLEPFRNRLTLITGLDMPEAMANEEERARVYGGIHYTFDQVAGQSAGRNVANFVFLNIMKPRCTNFEQ